MREFRTGYFAAPCSTDRFCKPGNVATRIDVTVRQVSTRTGEAMLYPFSDSPAHRAQLASVSRINVDHAQSNSFGFVSDKALKLAESPAVQPRPNPLPGLDIGADMRQVFHADFTSTGTDSFYNDGFADFVIYMFDMQAFAPGDSVQLAFSCTTIVGLKPPAVSKVFIAVVPQLSAAPDLTSTGCCEVILTNITAENATTGNWRFIGKVENEVEVPYALANDHLCFLRRTAGNQVALMLAQGESNLDTSFECEQGERVAFNRIGALVEVDGRFIELNCRNGLIFGDALVGLERLVGVGHAVNSLANHLATKRRERLSYCVIGQMVQGNPVPTAVLNGEWNDDTARTGEHLRQYRQRRRLVRACQKLHRHSAFHIGNFKPTETAMQPQKPSPYLPGLKGWVSRRH